MKKRVLVIICALFMCCTVRADNIITSLEYVKAETGGLLDKEQIPAKNTDTVLMHTGVSGTVGEKGIYNASNAYSEQTDNLVTAGAFNTAVQNALDTEFVCIERQNGNGGCLLYKIHTPTPQVPNTFANGYTQLEYLESTGTQYINTGVLPDSNFGAFIDFQYTNRDTTEQLAFGTSLPNFCVGRSSAVFGLAHKPGKGYNCYTRCASDSDCYVARHTAHINFMNDGDLKFDGNTRCNITTDLWSSDASRIFLFSLGNSGVQPYHSGAVRIYNLKLSNSNTIVHNYVPVRRDSDGALGMYDTVTNTFFTNAGTGDFIAGPVAYF
jgi:hypothetical protein